MDEKGLEQTKVLNEEKPDVFLTVASQARLEMPESKTKSFTWENNGKTINYDACASHIDVRSDTSKLIAKMFSVSYISNDETLRPVTFAYNGGPGSASVPVNFGGIGPKRVETDEMHHIKYCPEVKDNPHTLLKYSDLVFLDAPGTGWSYIAQDTKRSDVFGVDQDADCFARAIVSWLDEHDRWDSPVFIFGESYGTIRNAVLMRYLGERGVHLAGVVMLSSIFDWTMTLPGEDLYYLGMLPTFAATSQYFGKSGKGVDEDEWFVKAMNFTEEVYAPALLKGDRLSGEDMLSVATSMSEFIGLPVDYILENKLRVGLDQFRFNILKAEGKVCGRLDMRFSEYAPHPSQREDSGADSDPSDNAVNAAWNMAFRKFMKQDLGYEGPSNYILGNWEEVGMKWDFKHEAPGTGFKVGTPNVAFDIATALKRSPTTHIAFLGGRYDAATTLWNTYHDISCLFLPEDIKKNVHWYRYGCGHMAYTDVPTLIQMDKDLEEFYKAALAK